MPQFRSALVVLEPGRVGTGWTQHCGHPERRDTEGHDQGEINDDRQIAGRRFGFLGSLYTTNNVGGARATLGTIRTMRAR
jgi:hypothetical protein